MAHKSKHFFLLLGSETPKLDLFGNDFFGFLNQYIHTRNQSCSKEGSRNLLAFGLIGRQRQVITVEDKAVIKCIAL